jgi:hypothetical protein
MTDDDRHDDGDERDERIAARLEVPPLDDLTRRRLVQRAMAEAGPAAPSRATRFLRVAAAAVAVVVVGGAAALVLRDGDDPTRDASRPAAEPAPGAGSADEEALQEAPAIVDLGVVPSPEALRRRLEGALEQRAPMPASSAPGEEEAVPSADSFAGLTPECVTALVEVDAAPPLSVVGAATYRGSPALAVVDAEAAQAFVLDRSDPARCPLLDTVPLV